jgi:Zinc knuckle
LPSVFQDTNEPPQLTAGNFKGNRTLNNSNPYAVGLILSSITEVVAENFTIIPEAADVITRTEDKQKDIACDSTLAILMIHQLDPTRHGTLIAQLSNKYATWKDEYPKDLNARVHHTPQTAAVTNNTPAATSPEGSAMTFAQKAASQPSANGITHEGNTCFNCQGTGHNVNECPKSETATSLMQHMQTIHNGIDKN